MFLTCEGEGREGKDMKKGIGMCYVHVPTSHKEYRYYELQTFTNKKIILTYVYFKL